jgi:hypothetical protein
MKPKEEIDNLIARNLDWRGRALEKVRNTILEVDPRIVEEWKWMGSPVWELGGIICVGNIFKNKVQIVFHNGAAINDPDKVFNAGLTGNKWRTLDIFEGDTLRKEPFKNLVRSAINFNLSKKKG